MYSTRLLTSSYFFLAQERATSASLIIMVLALLISLFVSFLAVRFLLSRDVDHGELEQFPADYLSVLVVLIYAVFFLLSFRRNVYDVKSGAFFFCYFTMLLITAYIDLRTKYIYDCVLIVSAVMLFAIAFFIEGFDFKKSLLSMLIGAFFYGLIYLIARLIYRREAFGQGDIILMAISSLPLDPLRTLLSCFLSFYLAAFFLLIAYVLHLKKNGNEIPFGPYICLSSAIMWTYGEEIVFLIERLLLRNV